MKDGQVTEVSRLEAELNNELGSEGFSLLAHDVRSSMFGLLGSLELIDEKGLSVETRDRLNRARTSGALLNDLLNLIFGDAEISTPSIPFNVSEEIDLLIQRWFGEAQNSGIHIDLNIAQTVDTISVIDRTGFHRIFNNLLSNAIKFSQKGAISVNVVNREGCVEISISDTGPGFSESALSLLFEFRGRPSDSPQDGSGLGLYISNMLVSEAGGNISVENLDAGGARVVVRLPMSAPPIQQKITPKIDVLPDLSHLNILLAEDNVTNQMVVTQMLQSMGAKFQVAADGVETLAIFDKGDFDVVLLDIEMPRKSGLEVLREIRARSDAKSIVPMIALTAYVMQDHREKIDAAGADGLITKPIAGIASLGHQILEFVSGDLAPDLKIGDLAEEKLHNGVGHVDRAIYDVLTQTIGPEFLQEFLEKVLIDFECIKDGLIVAKFEEDYSKWRSHSHILISVAGAIGATKLQRLAQELNAAAKNTNNRIALPLNSQCLAGISEIIVFLNNEKTG